MWTTVRHKVKQTNARPTTNLFLFQPSLVLILGSSNTTHPSIIDHTGHTLYNATVKKRAHYGRWPHSPCLSVVVVWEDTNEHDAVSPWELVPLRVPNKSKNNTSLTTEMEVMDGYLASCQKVSASWDEWLAQNQAVAAPFLNDPATIAATTNSYLQVVALPMWVVLMQHRLQNGYYRSMASLVSDVNLMHNNAVEYNGLTSDVVIKSNFVCEKLLVIVENIFPGTVEKNTPEDDEETTMKENCRPSSMEVDNESDEEYVYCSDKEEEEEESDEEEEEEDDGVGQQHPNNKRRRVRKEKEEEE
jgi:hypothetical protein